MWGFKSSHKYKLELKLLKKVYIIEYFIIFMGWKDLPYSLRGALIFLIFPIVGLIGILNCNDLGCFGYSPFLLGILFLESIKPTYQQFYLPYHIINFILYLVIGAIIVWIVGKVKSK